MGLQERLDLLYRRDNCLDDLRAHRQEVTELNLLLAGVTLVRVLPLAAIQRQAKLASDDEYSQTNGLFTLANLQWLIPDAVFICPLAALIGFFPRTRAQTGSAIGTLRASS